jgi:hypothetical protein
VSGRAGNVRRGTGWAGSAEPDGRADRRRGTVPGQSAESSGKSSPDWAIRVKTNPVARPRGERGAGARRNRTAA